MADVPYQRHVQQLSATVHSYYWQLPFFLNNRPLFLKKNGEWQGFDTATHFGIISDLCSRFPQLYTHLFWIALVWSSHCAVCQVFHKRALYSRKRALYSCKKTHWYVLDSARVVEPLCCLPDIPQKRPIFPQKRPIVARKGPYSRKRALTCSE